LNPRPTHYECVALPLSYCGFAHFLSLGWPDEEPSQPIKRLNNPGKVVGAVGGVPLGDGVSLPYTMLELRRNLLAYVTVRRSGRIVSAAVMIAVAVNGDGRREVQGMAYVESFAYAISLGLERAYVRKADNAARMIGRRAYCLTPYLALPSLYASGKPMLRAIRCFWISTVPPA
jgi:mutator family transposase